MIKAVVFDIGNVLLEWHPERMYDAAIGETRRRALFAEVPLDAMNLEVDRGGDFDALIEQTAADYPGWRAEILMWRERWPDMASPVIDRSVRLMQALQARGVPVLSLTNFGIKTYDLAARHYPFLRAFDRDFISGHLGLIKPDPAIYAALEQGTGLPGETLLFTDDRAANITAAAARGWQTHLFEGSEGWAARLVAEGLLTEDEAA